MHDHLAGRRILVTGIADENSLALDVARALVDEGAELVCAGLGPTPHHVGLSAAAESYLSRSRESFEKVVHETFGPDTPTLTLDASLDGSLTDAAAEIRSRDLALDGVVHAIAMDRTIRGGQSPRLIDVSRKDFLDCLDISAYSLIAILRALLEQDGLRDGASVVSLSYLGAERVMSHPYRNIGVAKAALERITKELALELGRERRIRVNAVRFSPWSASRAGGAIPGLEDSVAMAEARSPLGNATPTALSLEVAHLMRPAIAITGEVRHVDGGYHVLG
jgi:enoyl-[acyl-carrier protein] reductase I